MKTLTILSLISLCLLGCDPGYKVDYFIKNNLDTTITYRLNWGFHQTLFSDTVLKVSRIKMVTDEDLGRAVNLFQIDAQSFYINDTCRITPCDPGMFVTDEESDSYGSYTILLSDSLLNHHRELYEKHGDDIFDCYDSIWEDSTLWFRHQF